MRKELKTIFVAVFAAVLMSNVAFGANPTAYGNSIEGTVLSVNGVTENTLEISIKNSKSEEVFNRTFANVNSRYLKKLDLKGLPKGKYVVKVENDYMIEYINLEVSENDIDINESNSKIVFKPQVVQNGEFVDIGFAAGSQIPVKVNLIDGTRVIFSKTFANEDKVTRLNLSNLAAGTYTLKFYTENNEFIKTINVR